MKKGAVLARERREKEKHETLYNDALKDFMQLKYGHIVAEFNSIYQVVMARRPAGLVYTGSKEFRLWRRREFHKELQRLEPSPVEPVVEPLEPSVDPEHLVNIIEPVVEPFEPSVDPEHLVNIIEPVVEPLEPSVDPEHLVNIIEPVVEPVEPPVDLEHLINEVVVDGVFADEGISLDAWEELQADISDLDYRLEVELGVYLP